MQGHRLSRSVRLFFRQILLFVAQFQQHLDKKGHAQKSAMPWDLECCFANRNNMFLL